MAQQTRLSSRPRAVSLPHAFRNTLSTAARLSVALAAALTTAVSARAQTPQQQYVYASVPVTTTTSEVAAFSKDGTTGVLTPLLSPPVPDNIEGGSMAVDALGRFLFIINPTTSKISMFQIDPSSGNLMEVPASPFSTGPTENPNMAATSPDCLATEASGQFLYIGYRSGNLPGHGAINEYLIDAAHQQLVPLAVQQTTDIDSAPIGMLTGLKGRYLYAGLDQNAGTSVYSIDPITGQLLPTGSAGNVIQAGRSIAIDPRSRFFFDSWGASQGFIDSAIISPSDGTATTGVTTIDLAPSSGLPSAMLAESSGKFLYVQLTAGVAVYSIDQTTGALTQTQPAAPILTFQTGTAVADPIGPYLYALEDSGVHGFQIDPHLGALSEIPGSPFTGASGGIRGLAISGTPVQAVSGPLAAFFPSSEAFGSVTVRQPSGTQIVSITNTGDQALILNLFLITGADAGDFTPTANCPALLPANKSCTVSVVFTPAAAGLRQASLTANDNAPGSPQSVPLSGTGVAPEPAVTLMPGSLSFPPTNQGTTSTPQSATLANAGMAALHVSSVLLSGANPNDFQLTNGCNGAYQVSATCSISVTFSPLANGLRTASIVIADDAPDSPQSVQLSGTGTGAPVTRPGVTLAPSAISFSAIAQGATSQPQTVTLTSSGTSALHISSVALGGANPTDFVLTNGCSAPAYAVSATCTISLTFAPLATGQRAATLTIADDAPSSPQTIALGGNANSAAFTLLSGAGGLTLSVTAGQTATYNLQLVPGQGFAGNVSFACSGAPATATCTTAPSPLRVTSGAPIPFTVSVATTATATIAPPWTPPRLPPFVSLRVLQTLVLCAILLLLCLAGRMSLSNAPERRRTRSSALAALALTALFVVAGCGGGASTAQSVQVPTPQPVTPSQTTITVTPSATNANGAPLANLPPIQLTLVVN